MPRKHEHIRTNSRRAIINGKDPAVQPAGKFNSGGGIITNLLNPARRRIGKRKQSVVNFIWQPKGKMSEDKEKQLMAIAYDMRPALERPPHAEGAWHEEFKEQRLDMVQCAILWKNMENEKIKKFLQSLDHNNE